MKEVAIIDYDMGNIDSVVRAVEECGGHPVVTDKADDLEVANYIILPGVGAFRDGMQNIRKKGLDKILREQVIEKSIPFLGICLGMQLLATKSFEEGETEGFNWIAGDVRRLEPDKLDMKVPHIGWNEVESIKPSALFQNIPSRKDFYFIHSYHLVCEDKEDILALTPYCGTFVSAVNKGNIFGVQFHPEKSQRFGIKLISNFLTL